MVPGVYASTPVLAAWIANNSEPHYRRATSVALGFMAANSVCSAVTFIIFRFNDFLYISGRHFEYMELPLKSRTKFQENNNYESHLVSVPLVSPFFPSILPLYLPFCSSTLGSSLLVIMGCLLNVAFLSWRNNVKKRPEVRQQLLEKYATGEKGDGGSLSAWTELGDRHPDFVYTLWILHWAWRPRQLKNVAAMIITYWCRLLYFFIGWLSERWYRDFPSNVTFLYTNIYNLPSFQASILAFIFSAVFAKTSLSATLKGQFSSSLSTRPSSALGLGITWKWTWSMCFFYYYMNRIVTIREQMTNTIFRFGSSPGKLASRCSGCVTLGIIRGLNGFRLFFKPHLDDVELFHACCVRHFFQDRANVSKVFVWQISNHLRMICRSRDGRCTRGKWMESVLLRSKPDILE